MVNLMVLILGVGVSGECPVDRILIVSGIICAWKHGNIIIILTTKPVYMEIGERDQLMIM